MDFTVIKKFEIDGVCYKLLKTNFYRNYYVIIAQDRREFYCGSIYAKRDEAELLFDEISQSGTNIYCVADILSDFSKQKV